MSRNEVDLLRGCERDGVPIGLYALEQAGGVDLDERGEDVFVALG